ncbi:MAG TPA: hypothetical protein VN657_10320 [Nitrospiraceae bacterium]|jgi:hypothetical protein|nr:hypothetical protein [Nitrospiraceae bacterium]
MNGNHDAKLGKDVSRLSGPGLGWNDFSGEWVACVASITPAIFFSGERKGR